MIWKQIFGWFVLAAVISCSATVTSGETVTATIGDPYILKFEYNGPRRGVRYRFSKDDKPFVPERYRVFWSCGRISFLEITDDDAGLYQLEVQGRRIQYSKAINLLGM